MEKTFYSRSKGLMLAACLLTGNAFLSAQTYTTIGLSGYNADVIANGIGNASASTSIDVDNGGFAYVSGDFRATPSSSAPTYSLPASGSFTSAATSGLPFQMASFSANNALRLPNAGSGTLTFFNPMRAQNVYPLVIGGGGAVSGISFTVTFEDASTQVFTGQTAPDWYGNATNARSGVGRVSRSTNGLEGSSTTPRLFQLNLAIDAANQTKRIVSITVTSGTGGILNVFGISVRTPSGLSCEVPTALAASGITAGTATISWTANGTPNSYEYVYGPYGASGFDPASVTPLSTGTASAPLGSLSASTLYQVYVRQVCGGTPGAWAGPLNFTTALPACTGAPVAGTVTGPSVAYNSDAVALALNGNSDPSAVSALTVQWQKSATALPGSWTNISGGTTVSISNTLGASSYYRAYLYCSATGLSDTSGVKFVLGYCKPTYVNSTSGYRPGNVTYGSINNTTTTNTVTDFTNLSTTVEAGVANPMSVTTYGFTGFAVAADFNSDGDFGDPDEIIFPGTYSAASGTVTVTANVTIPGNIPAGAYRMRVYSWGGNSGASQPCWTGGTGTYGSFRDYTVNVTNSATCFPPSAVTVSNVQPHTADAIWTASATAPTGYEWRLMEGMGNPDIDPAVTGGSVSAATTAISISGLAGQTTYRLYVRSACGANNSVWTNAAAFTTLVSCAPPVSLSSSGVTANTATINWSAPATTSPGGYEIYYSTVNTAPNASTVLTPANSYTGITGLSQLMSGLTHNTTYYVWVRSNCGAIEGNSSWASVASFTTAVSCYPVTGLDINTIAGNTVSFSWTAPVQGNPVVNYQYELRTSGAAGSGAAGLAQSGFSNMTGQSLTGLVSGTAYTFYVRTDCNANDSSSWVSKVYTVPTYVPITITSYNQDVIAEGVASAVSTTTTAVDDATSSGTGGFAYLSSTYRNPATPATVPAYSLPANGRILSGVKYFQLAPYNQVNSTRLAAANAFDTMKFFTPRSAKTVNILAVSGSGASTANFRVLFSDNTFADFNSQSIADWYGGSPIVLASVGRVSRTSNVAEGASNGPNLYEKVLTLAATDTLKTIKGIVVTKTSASGFLNIFGVSIIPSAAACEVPTALATNNITSSTADFTWNGTSASYQVSYGTQGTTADNGTLLPLQSGTSYSFGSLNAGTNYVAYVRGICGSNPGDTSFWAGPVSFTTNLSPCTGTPMPGAVLATASDLCVSGTSTLSLTNNYLTNSGISYQWESSDNGTSWTDVNSATAATYTTPLLTATTYYRCRVTCSAGPSTGYSDNKTITVHALPTVTVSPAQAAFCSAGSVTLTAAGASTYTWSPVSDISAATGASVNASPVSLMTYTVTGTDIYGCSNTATTTVGPISDITPVASAVDVCPGNMLSINITPIVAASGTMEYQVTDLMGNVAANWQSSTLASVTPAANGLNQYLVFARNTDCPASVSDSGNVKAHAGFEASVQVNDATCANGDGSIVVGNPEGPGADNTLPWYSNDFSSATLSATQAVLYGNAAIAGGYGIITPSATGNRGAIAVLNPASINSNAMKVTFDMSADNPINNFGTGGADGMAYSFGDDANYSASVTNGSGSKLRVVFDAANNGSENNNHAGVYVTYGYSGNTQMGDASAGVLAHSTFTNWKNTTNKPVAIVIADDGKLTLTWNDTVIFSNVQLPAAYTSANKASWKHLFTAFTGGDALRFAIDNLSIRSGAETFSYGKTAANSATPPATWQSNNSFTGLSGGDTLDIWIANPSNPAACNQKLGTYAIAAPVMTSLYNTTAPTCIGASDGHVAIKVNTAGTYNASYAKDGGAVVTVTGLASVNNGTDEIVTLNLPQGTYSNIRLTSSGGCVSNANGPAVLTAPAASAIAGGSYTTPAIAQTGAGIQYYTDASCNLIAGIASPNNLGTVTAAVTVTGSTFAGMYFNEPYVGRYYEIAPSANSTLPAQLTLYFSPAEFAAYNASPLVGGSDYPAILPDGSNLRISVYHGLPSSGNSGPTGTYDASNSNLLQPSGIVWNAAGGWWEVTVNSPYGFSAFFANTNTGTPLPVVLGNISAVNAGRENHVQWDTRTEHAGDYFEIERSGDGKRFAKVGTVTAKGAAPAQYRFTDTKPFNGVNYYRLRMINMDGAAQYSKVVNATVSGAAFGLAVYPNPVNSELTVKAAAMAGNAVVEITDIAGRTILTRAVGANGIVAVPMDQLANGVYLVTYHDDLHTQTIKVNKQ
jgi:hypothetical protein